jgi:GH24 family phage-related lysozyme (muramidase)
MTRPVNKAALELVKTFEGYRNRAYLCPANVWTIGYGHTGPEVKEGLTCTERQAALWLKEDLAKAGRLVEARIGSVARELTDNQYGALCSFVFNLGASPGWTVWKVLKARNFDAVPAQLSRFVYAGKKKLNGLVRRRAAEVQLWSTDEPGTVDEDLPSSSTRAMDTPPAVEKPKSGSIVTAAVSACAGVPVAAKAVTDAVSPYADASPIVGQIVAFVATLAAGAAIAVLVLNWLQNRRSKS